MLLTDIVLSLRIYLTTKLKKEGRKPSNLGCTATPKEKYCNTYRRQNKFKPNRFFKNEESLQGIKPFSDLGIAI